MSAIDIGVIVAYFVGITLFGCSFYWRKDADDSREFMEGGGAFPVGRWPSRSSRPT